FVRNHREVDVLDLTSNQIRTLATGRFDPHPFASPRAYDFSPDSKWIAYLDNDPAMPFLNAWVVPVAGGTPRAVSFLSNAFGDSLVWSNDGKFLVMVSGQRTGTVR